ncbi:MAG: sn-glycerol-3-phosphate ABC transporter ATP-binding protein UgpC [Actinomycetota bacterium]
MAEVTWDHVTKQFDDVTAVQDLTLTAADGEFLILVGPSGCGKTTALRMVAGLEQVTSGTIRIGDRVVNHVTPRDRDIAMVFQNYALYPHMSVYKNLAFGLKERKTPKVEIERRVREVGETLGLTDLMKRRPAQLSGGQRQRVAMGRALVREPVAFLMDEPLSNLDAKLRVQMRAELKRLHQSLGVTTVYVTHDQVEAMTLGDRIVVMANGKVQQIGRPQDVYRAPANLFVAGFIGSPPMNLVRASVTDGQIQAGTMRIPAPAGATGEVALGFRPEDLELVEEGSSFQLAVEVVEPLGHQVVVHGTTEGTLVDSGAQEEEIPIPLDGARTPVTAVFPPDREPVPGASLRVTVPPERAHIFDLRTGEAIRP